MSILNSLDAWLEQRERIYRRADRVDQAKAISHLRATRDLTLANS